jgi:hypothetical protein
MKITSVRSIISVAAVLATVLATVSVTVVIEYEL